MKTKLLALLAIGLCVVAVVAGLSVFEVATSSGAPPQTPTADQIRNNILGMLQRKPTVPIKVLPDIPGPGGAPRATNRDAAYYAWQEFIALNWPNVPVSGNAAKLGATGARETADITLQFGQPPRPSTTNYPALVWESTRHRSEIYTGYSCPPNGFTNNANVSWGYNSSPGYVYPDKIVGPAPGPPTSKVIKPGLTPFVNLDEGSQIGLCTMYTGVPYSAEGPSNFVFFMAKGNYNEYGYIASRGWYDTQVLQTPLSPGTPIKPVASFANTSGYIVTQGKFPPAGDLDGSTSKGPGSYVSFPSGTLEFKAAFRVATNAERLAYEQGKPIPGGYHAAPIRYYQDLATGAYQYVDTVGVLLSLHIIHKTPTAPYFIFATFEHKDDVIGMDGKPVEDADGNLNPNAFTSTPPATPTPPYVYPSSGTAPAGQYLVDATTPNIIEVPSQYDGSTVTVQQIIPSPNSNAGPISTRQSSYQNTRNGDTSTLEAANSPSVTQSYLTVNRRRFSIPQQPIIEVNKDIHNLIAMYGYNKTNNVWLNYKLVNVQWVPAGNKTQKTPGKLYGDTSGGAKPFIAVESYYLSNSLVETNLVLSAFSGRFGPSSDVYDGSSITDFYFPQNPPNQNPNIAATYTNNNIYVNGQPQTINKNVGDPFYNIYTNGGPYNMGGCMGCHGNTAVNNGSDASFILSGAPFSIEGVAPPQKTMLLRHRSYFGK